MRNIGYALILLTLLFSCREEQHFTGLVEVVEIDVNARKDYNFSHFFDTCYIVPLETTDAALIGGISSITLKDERIFILDSRKSKSIFVYDWKGRLKTLIDQQGEGPGQYLHPFSMGVSASDSIIYIFDSGSHQRVSFTWDGNFIESEKLSPAIMYNDLIHNNGFFYTAGGEDYMHKAKAVNVWDADFNLLKRIDVSLKGDIWIQNGRKRGYFYEKSDGNGVLYKGFRTNSIITIENDSISRIIQLNLSDNSFDYDPDKPIPLTELAERLRQTEDYIVGDRVLDSPKYFFVDVARGDHGLTAVYDKTTQEAQLIGKLINDMDGMTVSVSGIFAESNSANYFIIALFPRDFKENAWYKKIKGPYDQMLHAIQLDDADNPILFIYRFKQ